MGFILSAFADEASNVFTEQMEALSREGIRLIELRGVDGVSCADLTAEQAKRARAVMDDSGVALSALGSPYGKVAIDLPFREHLDHFERGMELCGILGAKRVRMFSFYMPKDKDPNDYRDEVLERLDRMLDMARSYGVEPVHENEKAIYGDNTERSLVLARAFEGRMGLVFDPANFVQCGVRPGEAYPVLKPYLRYFHVKDALLRDGSVVPAGKGDGSVRDIIADLCPEGDMVLTVEPHLAVFKGLENLQSEQVRHKYTYASAAEAFHAAVSALKEILNDLGYTERSGIWKK